MNFSDEFCFRLYFKFRGCVGCSVMKGHMLEEGLESKFQAVIDDPLTSLRTIHEKPRDDIIEIIILTANTPMIALLNQPTLGQSRWLLNFAREMIKVARKPHIFNPMQKKHIIKVMNAIVEELESIKPKTDAAI